MGSVDWDDAGMGNGEDKVTGLIERCTAPWPLKSPARNDDLKNPWRLYSDRNGVMMLELKFPTIEAAAHYARRTIDRVFVRDHLPED